jgi:hypothetical protein
MHADRQSVRRPSAKNDHSWRRRNATRHGRWMCTRVMMSLPACQQRVLDRIEQRLAAEDPGLELRLAVFTWLTQHEAIPGAEQVPGRLQQVLRRVVILPLVVISLVTLLAAGGLAPSQKTCPGGTHEAVAGMSPESRAARCQPAPAVKEDQLHAR